MIDKFRLVPHIDQYIGAWAMYPPRLVATLDTVQGLDILSHIDFQLSRSTAHAEDDEDGKVRVTVENGVAVVDMIGTITKYGSSLAAFPGTLEMRRMLRALAQDEAVDAVLLRIDSPGGSIAGVDDLARDVAHLAMQKPTTAFIEDMGASAAYYFASQATTVVANPSAIVGSIGVYAVIADFSKAAAEDGIKVHVIRSVEMKGKGVPGTEVTDEQLADFQREVDAFHELFVAAVARGRNLPLAQVRAFADGRVHIGQAAVELGLIDGVMGLEEALSDLQNGITKAGGVARRDSNVTENIEMNDPQKKGAAAEPDGTSTAAVETTPKPATIQELKASMPDANAEFREKCLEGCFTLPQAKDAWIVELRETNAQQAKTITEQEKKAQEKADAHQRPGVKPVGNGGSAVEDDAGSVVDQVNALVAEKVKGGMKRHKAFAAVARENVELSEAYDKQFATV